MIDFINLKLPSTEIPRMMNHPQLDWTVKVSEKTGEIQPNTKTAQYGELEFLFKKGKGEHLHLKGSIHKHWDKNQMNHRDFFFTDFAETIINLCHQFDLNPYLMDIKNVELGLNIHTPFDHKRFLFEGLLCYRFKPFQLMHTKGKKPIGVKCVLQQYDLKAYSKKLQYNLKDDIFRWEIHINKKEPLKKYNVSNLGDLVNLQKMVDSMGMVWTKFDDCLTCEPNIQLKQLLGDDHRLILDGQSIKYWQQKNRWIENKEQRNHLSYLVDKFRLLNQIHTTEPQHEQIASLLRKKTAQLMKMDDEKFRLLTNFLQQFPECDIQTFNGSSMGLIVLNGNFPSNRKRTINSPSPKRVCLGCGNDISHQQQNTIFCTAKWVGERTAHRCRNINSNKRNNLRRKIQIECRRGILFPIWETYEWEVLKDVFLVQSKTELLKELKIKRIA